MKRPAILVLLALIACESGKDGGTTRSPSTGPPSEPLRWLVNGKEEKAASILAYSEGGRAKQLVISNRKLTCKEILGDGRGLEEGELTLTLSVAPAIAKDGKERWRVKRMAFPGWASERNHGAAVIVADGDKEIRARLDAKQYARPLRGKPLKIVLRGELAAQRCGTRSPPTKPQPLTFEFQGKEHAIRGAVVEAKSEDTFDLTVGTGDGNCESSVGGNGADLTLRWSVVDKKVTSFQIDGDLLDIVLSDDVHLDRYVVKPGGSVLGEGPVEFELFGKRKMWGYSVSIKGKVKALRCPP